VTRRHLLIAAALLALVPPAFASDPAPGPAPGDDPGAEIFLPRMLVPAIQNDQVRRHYALLVKLRLARKEDVELVRAAMDKLQNAFVYDLNDVASQGDHFDRERAQRRMLASSTRILGKPGVIEDIVFERVLERRIAN
jgi:hypothetical protein